MIRNYYLMIEYFLSIIMSVFFEVFQKHKAIHATGINVMYGRKQHKSHNTVSVRGTDNPNTE